MLAPVLLLCYQRLPADGRLPYQEHRKRPLPALLSSLCLYAPFVCFVCSPCLHASFVLSSSGTESCRVDGLHDSSSQVSKLHGPPGVVSRASAVGLVF